MKLLIEIGYFLGMGIILIFFLYVGFRVIFYSFFKTKSQFANHNNHNNHNNHRDSNCSNNSNKGK